jgi:hypothetical protein
MKCSRLSLKYTQKIQYKKNYHILGENEINALANFLVFTILDDKSCVTAGQQGPYFVFALYNINS